MIYLGMKKVEGVKEEKEANSLREYPSAPVQPLIRDVISKTRSFTSTRLPDTSLWNPYLDQAFLLADRPSQLRIT
jgi:hypothetical protein